jgi:hypothetical protein
VQARKPTPQHDWTDANQGDPGLPLLELLAYVLDEVGFYLDRIANEARLRRRRRDAVLAGPLPSSSWGGGDAEVTGTTIEHTLHD